MAGALLKAVTDLMAKGLHPPRDASEMPVCWILLVGNGLLVDSLRLSHRARLRVVDSVNWTPYAGIPTLELCAPLTLTGTVWHHPEPQGRLPEERGRPKRLGFDFPS